MCNRTCSTATERPITEVDSTNKVIFNYVRERGIEGNEIIYKDNYWMLTITVCQETSAISRKIVKIESQQNTKSGRFRKVGSKAC